MLLVLNYHQLLSPANGERRLSGNFTVSQAQFEQQINWLCDHRFRFVSSPSELDFSGKNVLLTFDDGLESHFSMAIPLLEKRNIPALFFPVIDRIGKPGYMTWEQLRILSQSGRFTIGCHSYSHPKLTSLSNDLLLREINGAKLQLEEKLSVPILHFALPYGKHRPSLIELLLQNGFIHIYTTQSGYNEIAQQLVQRWNIKTSTNMRTFRRICTQKRFVSGTELLKNWSRLWKFAT